MNALRTIAAVLFGYLLYAASSMLLVGVVMSREGAGIIISSLVGLAVIGLVAGFMASTIAGGSARPVAFVLAGVVALATLANLVLQLGAEPAWYKVATLVLTVPAILLVGLRR